MQFIEKCKELIDGYKEQGDYLIRKNGTILLSPDGVSLYARHKFYKGLKEEYINEFLVPAYEYSIPETYLEFLRFSNGADLYAVKVRSKRDQICGLQVLHFAFMVYR